MANLAFDRSARRKFRIRMWLCILAGFVIDVAARLAESAGLHALSAVLMVSSGVVYAVALVGAQVVIFRLISYDGPAPDDEPRLDVATDVAVAPEATDPAVKPHVYVMGFPGADLVKIGTSIYPTIRLAEIRRHRNKTIVPSDVDRSSLELLFTTEGDSRLERALHRYFGDRRVCGEWFMFAPDVAVREVSAAIDELREAIARCN